MQRLRKSPQLRTLIFRRISLVNVLIVFLGLLLSVFLLFRAALGEIAQARIDVMRQVASSNQLLKSFATTASDRIGSGLSDKLAYAPGSAAELGPFALTEFQSVQEFLSSVGVDLSFDVITEDGGAYSSVMDESELQYLLRSYWYLTLSNGTSDNSWCLRILSPDEKNNVVLSHGRCLRASDGRIVGALVINLSQQALYDTYQKILNDDNRIYILDENGTAISHSNPGIIGFTLYDMRHFEKYVGPRNGYRLVNKPSGLMLISNYFDPKTGWTVVEEMRAAALFLPYIGLTLLCFGILLLSLALALAASRLTARKIVLPLEQLTDHMHKIESHHFSAIEVSDAYTEVTRLGHMFNSMLQRIARLIENIRLREQEKRSLELSLLQAQINPHFMHNTLFTIKSLVELGESERASGMLTAFTRFLEMPMLDGEQCIPLKKEIENVRNYMDIMEYRYEKHFVLNADGDKGWETVSVPRMILQPIIENAIFHGLACKPSGGTITIYAALLPSHTSISVQDDGVGMTEEQLKGVWLPTAAKQAHSHHIGLHNVLGRIRLIYGRESSLSITSHKGEGTTVTLLLQKEGSNENFDC